MPKHHAIEAWGFGTNVIHPIYLQGREGDWRVS
jgi:hypothetical protein